jgi:Cu(I)/Ag(I) efflux system membrane fusion protein
MGGKHAHRSWRGLLCVLALLPWGAGAGQAGALAADVSAAEHEHVHGDASDVDHARYTCPMHPQVQANEPGRCPICGMDLALAPNSDARDDAPAREVMATVAVSPRAAQVLGLRRATVETRDIAAQVATYARVVADSVNESIMSAPAEGWIRALHVNQLGARVEAGAPLFELYAPELQQRQRDYIDTLNRRDQMLATLTSMEGQNGQLLASLARERMRLRDALLELGIARASLDDIERLRRVRDSLTVVARGDGQVTRLEARVGQAVAPGEALYRLLDGGRTVLEVMLSPRQRAALQAPVELSVAESSAPRTVALDGALFDARAQSYGVRIAVADIGSHAPGEVLAVTLRGARLTLPSVPRAALLEDGVGAFVVVADGSESMRLRRVEVAARDEAWVGVRHGLGVGESVVVDGQYLLDAAATLTTSFGAADAH